MATKTTLLARQATLLIAIAALNTAAVALLTWRSFGLHSIGVLDFEVHHAAFAATLDGNNPYDPLLLGSYLDPALGYIPRKEFAFFYPPWVLIVLSPILILPIKTAALVWICVSLALLAGSSLLILDWAGQRPERSCFVAGAAILLFPPALDSIMFGQVNLLCTFALAVVMWAVDRKRDWLAGLFIPIAMLKPQIVFLPALILAYFVWRDRNRRFVCWAGVSLVLLLVLTTLLSATLVQDWISNLWASAKYVGATVRVSNSLPGQIVRITSSLWGWRPDWLKVGIPLLSLAALGTLLMRFKNTVKPDTWLPPAIILSPFLSGYSWFHDNVVLILPYSIVLSRACDSRLLPSVRSEIWAWALLLNLATLGAMLVTNPEINLFLYPLGMFFLYQAACRLCSSPTAHATPKR